MKGTLFGKQSTFTAVTRAPIDDFRENSPIALYAHILKKDASLVTICQYLDNKLASRKYLGLRSRKFRDIPDLAIYSDSCKLRYSDRSWPVMKGTVFWEQSALTSVPRLPFQVFS
jgi:hypothetical protein